MENRDGSRKQYLEEVPRHILRLNNLLKVESGQLLSQKKFCFDSLVKVALRYYSLMRLGSDLLQSGGF